MTVYSQSQVYQLATSVGLPARNALIASAVAMAESSGDANAINRGSSIDTEYSVGLWQINLLAHPQYTVTQMQDPTQNAKAMSVISNSGTAWGAWGTYVSGLYKKYMSSTIVATPVLASSYGSLASTPMSGLLDLTTGLIGTSTNPSTTSDIGSAWTYVLAYLVAAGLLIAVSRFQAGYNALYYLAVLFLMLLVLTQASFIANALKPITQPSSSTSSSSGTVSPTTGSPTPTISL